MKWRYPRKKKKAIKKKLFPNQKSIIFVIGRDYYIKKVDK